MEKHVKKLYKSGMESMLLNLYRTMQVLTADLMLHNSIIKKKMPHDSGGAGSPQNASGSKDLAESSL